MTDTLRELLAKAAKDVPRPWSRRGSHIQDANGDWIGDFFGPESDRTISIELIVAAVNALPALLADRAELAALREAVNSAPVGWYDSVAQTVFMDGGHEPPCASGICDVIVMRMPASVRGEVEGGN